MNSIGLYYFFYFSVVALLCADTDFVSFVFPHGGFNAMYLNEIRKTFI
jgi:hypothetical protein